MSTYIVPTTPHGLTSFIPKITLWGVGTTISLILWLINGGPERSHNLLKVTQLCGRTGIWIQKIWLQSPQWQFLAGISAKFSILFFHYSHIPSPPVKENPTPLPVSFSLPSPWICFFCYLCQGCSPHCFILPHKNSPYTENGSSDVAKSIMKLNMNPPKKCEVSSSSFSSGCHDFDLDLL